MNAFDQFDAAPSGGNPFDQFDAAKPTKIGSEGFGDFLRAELQNADWGTRNIAGFGTALSNVWEGAKQYVGKGDRQQIEANRIIEQEAPVGAIAGNVAMTAIPFAAPGNSINTAAKLGTVMGALHPVEGEQTARNIVEGKLKSTAMGGATAALGQGIANKAGEYVTNKLSELALRKAQNAPLEQTLNEAMDAGLKVTPSSVNPSFANTLKEGIAGKIATAQDVSNQNAPKFDSLMRRAIGLPDDVPLTSQATQAVRDKAYAWGYKPVTDVPAINWDHAFLNDVAKLSPKSAGGAVKNPAQGEIDDLITSLTDKKQWTGEQLVRDIRALREQSRANFNSAERAGGDAAKTDLGRAQSKAAELLEGLADRNIVLQGGSPKAIENMRAARRLIAKAHDVEDAIVEGGGTADVRKIARMFQNGKPLTDELRTVGAFANNFKNSSQPAAQIQGPGVSKLNSALSFVLGLGGSSMGPVGAAAGAAAPFVIPPLARKALLSKRSQNALRDMYRLGMAPRAANRLLQHAPVGGTVLGMEALSQ